MQYNKKSVVLIISEAFKETAGHITGLEHNYWSFMERVFTYHELLRPTEESFVGHISLPGNKNDVERKR